MTVEAHLLALKLAAQTLSETPTHDWGRDTLLRAIDNSEGVTNLLWDVYREKFDPNHTPEASCQTNQNSTKS